MPGRSVFSPGDRFIVREPDSERQIERGAVNQPFEVPDKVVAAGPQPR